MAECRLCKTHIPDGEEYCRKCFENNRAKIEESYLDNLLKSVVNTHNSRLFNRKKALPDKSSDFANTSSNKTLSDNKDKDLLNRNLAQNITKQDEKNLREENNKEKELNNSTDEDILSFLDDYSEDGKNEGNSDIDAMDSYYDNENETSEMEDTDEDLLALLDMISAQDEANSGKNSEVTPDIAKNEDMTDSEVEVQHMEEDILSIADLPIEDLTAEELNNFEEDLLKEIEKPSGASDVGGIFSDVLSAVDTLEDKEKINLENVNPVVPENSGRDNDESNKGKKKGFWQKIFGKKEENQDDTVKTKAASKADKKAEKKKEAKINTEEKKKPKKEKKSKVKSAPVKNSSGEESEKVKGKKAKPKAKASKAVKKKPARKVKKESTAQIAQAIEDSDDNVKINKLAIIFVMTFFILIGGFVILGTNLYSYSLSIKNANLNFNRQRYTEAYKQVYGLDIRKNDSKTYEKIMTVMFVNKELNSYNNYMEIKKYPEALDSLLKGIERYDKYIKRAADLGIKEDMNHVRNQILDELKKQFNISEEEAVALNNSEDQTQYSINVINMVQEKMK